MSLPSYTKHLSNSPLVSFDGQSLMSPINPLHLIQYGFVPGFLDSLAALLVDTGMGKPKLVPPGPLTLYSPYNPFEEPITVGTPTLSDTLVSLLSTKQVTKTFDNGKINVTITGSVDDVDKALVHLKSLP